MTNDFTAEDLLSAARVNSLYGFHDEAEILLTQARELEEAQARDTEAEQLAEIMWDTYRAAEFDTTGITCDRWENASTASRAVTIAQARAALDHLASRLAPDNGITLTADEVERFREDSEALHRWFVEHRGLRDDVLDGVTRLRARFAPTEQAEPKPIPLPTEPGARIKASVRRWPGALTWADEDPHVGEFTLEADGSTWSDDEIGVVRGCFDHITVLKVLPAEKPEPRSWPSLDQVPHDVMVEGGPQGNRAVWGEDVTGGYLPMWRWMSRCPVPRHMYPGTWTEVSL